jgi:hypothetical protein
MFLRVCCFAIQFSRNKSLLRFWQKPFLRFCRSRHYISAATLTAGKAMIAPLLRAANRILPCFPPRGQPSICCSIREVIFVFLLRRDGGAKEDRTPDLLLARQALSQLSYGPIEGYAVVQVDQVVGLSGLEPPTSPLSGVRSNQLS